MNQPALVELACGVMRLPLLRSFAWHVFFGRNSFPDIDTSVAASPAAAELAVSKTVDPQLAGPH